MASQFELCAVGVYQQLVTNLSCNAATTFIYVVLSPDNKLRRLKACY
jgi:hypothetical protein